MYLIAKEETQGGEAGKESATASGRVSHGCHVSAEAEKKGLKAAEWANAVAGAVGGKAGGKGSTSVGSGTEIAKVEEGVEEARKWFEKFGL